MKVYDIINAGDKHRFTANGRVVSNCGKLVQLQNLPQNHLKDLDLARQIVKENDIELLEILYESPMDVFSQLVRTALIAEDGKTFVVCDYSAIEARVVAWLAGETWALEEFRGKGKIYEATAAQMYGVPIEQVTKGSELRKKGKIAVLACIAAGTLIDTERGAIPIENVIKGDKVFDGYEYVECDGAIYKGEKEVITYDGLNATPDHLVWIEGENRAVPFGESARSGKRLFRPKTVGTNIRTCKSDKCGEEIHKTEISRVHDTGGVPNLPRDKMDKFKQSDEGRQQGLSKLFGGPEAGTAMALQKDDRSETQMREQERLALPRLRRARHTLRISEHQRSLQIHHGNIRTAQRTGTGQNRQRQGVRAGKSSICYTEKELLKSTDNNTQKFQIRGMAVFGSRSSETYETRNDQRGNSQKRTKGRGRETKELAGDKKSPRKVKVYDILNCGPFHRYTANGVLVHNCGYGGGAGALAKMDKRGDIKEEDRQPIIDAWRQANPHIVQFWKKSEAAAKKAILHPGATLELEHGIAFKLIDGVLFVTLPSGRAIAYQRARLKRDEMHTTIVYMGQNQTTQKWEEVSTWGGKIVENIVQSVARDCLGEAMLRLAAAGYAIRAHVHDEVIIEVNAGNAESDLQTVRQIMRLDDLSWKGDLPLNAEGYICSYYRKD